MDRIGVGGFATVWLYHDDELDSDVAVKALADNWAQRLDVRERFLEEARILRRADSDHVVRVYDIGQAGETPYFVMSYADRGSLAGLLRPGVPMPSAPTLDLVEQAAAGLRVLHEHGVIHRDIKPQNLLLGSRRGGGVKVMVADLGVAKAMLHASGLTQVVGTPAYMAPEQATGEALDTRADVHALGAVAYQMLTGQLVRRGGIGELNEPRLPPAASSLAPLPPEVDPVLARALAVEPEQRWPDVTSFSSALGAALTPETDTRIGTRPQHRTADVGQLDRAARRTEFATPRTPDLPTPDQSSRGNSRAGLRGLPLLLICVLVLIATFGASYAVTMLLR